MLLVFKLFVISNNHSKFVNNTTSCLGKWKASLNMFPLAFCTEKPF